MNTSDQQFPEEAFLPEKDHYTKEEINSILVHYCVNCHSLDIRRYNVEEIPEFCGNCSGTDISTMNIHEWIASNAKLNQ